ncbi:ATP-grasp fold amidoligase family protein [Helicobacter canis]|uniref:Putative glycosyltransferase n=1 Tax=Helicobacter canis TaxID=29419 RepID=A0A377J224_9HELI|nr:ATP-grasp fold amidoligase family protein [Helicobacter canis]STO96531.1 putative glycosyltransferase [Helicobacter canis]STP06529.1 putative glycosyltransferase [Helicobacter canis]
MSQEPQSFKSRLKESIKHNPIYTKAIRPLRVKLNALIESTLDDEAYFVRRHKKIFGYTPDFRNPKTFNEKIIHRILFDRSPVYTALADKLKARIYIAATLYPLYENAIRGGAECDASLDSSLDSSAHTIQALAKLNLLEPSSTLFAPIDSLGSTLLATNICPYLPKLYGIYKSFDEIDFASLPTSFAIKTNHDGGGVVLVPNKQEFLSDQARFEAARSKIQSHLATNFYTLFREWHYKDIEPRVFIEELLGASSPANTAPNAESSTDSSTKTFENDDFHNKIAQNLESYKAPTDYKCHIFNGALSHIDTIIDKFTNQTEIAMTPTWEKMPFDYDKKASHIPKKPKNLALMQELAISLADKFSYVRVDLYEIDEQIIVGELTFTPTGGTDRFSPMQWDRNLGDLWV